MISVGKEWNPKQAKLRELFKKKDTQAQGLKLCQEMHALVHSSKMTGSAVSTFEDRLWENLSEPAFRAFPKAGGASIAWNIWHISRIEDITANILVADGDQVLDDQWLNKMHTKIRDTGNAMTDEEIFNLSNELNMRELANYRIAVGRKTQKILQKLQTHDLNRKFTDRQIRRLFNEGGILEHEESQWLGDFWGRKKVSGILLMPITRHQIVHLNDSLKIKARYMKKET